MPFTLFDSTKKERSLSEFRGKKTILAFLPGAFTGVCDKELCTFRDSTAELNDLNAQVVAINVDSPFANKAFANAYDLKFPILSDYSREVAGQYAGLHKDFAGMKGYDASKRAVFVLDEEGKVIYSWITDNPGVEPDYDEVKKALT